MSFFSDLAGSARSAHSHYFAEEVTVQEPGSADQAVRAVLGKVKTETRTDENGRQQRVSTRNCRFVDVSSLRHDSLVVEADGTQWAIDDFLDRPAGGLRVQLLRVKSHDVHRVNYRGKR